MRKTLGSLISALICAMAVADVALGQPLECTDHPQNVLRLANCGFNTGIAGWSDLVGDNPTPNLVEGNPSPGSYQIDSVVDDEGDRVTTIRSPCVPIAASSTYAIEGQFKLTDPLDLVGCEYFVAGYSDDSCTSSPTGRDSPFTNVSGSGWTPVLDTYVSELASSSMSIYVTCYEDASGPTFTMLMDNFIAAGPIFLPEPVGDDFQVNSYTTGDQRLPSVAADADGNFVVVWRDFGSGSIQGRRFAADGTPLGDDFQVNSYTTSYHPRPSVAADADGDFVVVWTRDGSAGSDTDWSIQGRRFAADGTPVGDDFQVNSYTLSRQWHPSVVAGPDGNFVVVWQSSSSGGSDTLHSIQGRRFAADGTPLGDDFQVNSYTTGRQYYPSVATDPEGDFVVVWRSDGSGGSDTDYTSIQGRRFAADATPLGNDFQVNTYTTGRQYGPSVAIHPGGDFVVVWASYGSEGSDADSTSIQGRRFAADGTPLGDDFQVNTFGTSYQFGASAAVHPDGRFVVVWQSYDSGGSDTYNTSIQGRWFTAVGTPIGHDFQVNTYTTSDQASPSVAADANGDFVVAWQSAGSSGSDSSGYSIQGRRFTVPIFTDGFESGDTSAWSSSVP